MIRAKKQGLIIAISMLTLISIIIQSCSGNETSLTEPVNIDPIEANTLMKKSSQKSEFVHKFSKSLAKLLKNKKVRKIIAAEIEKSENTSQVVDFKTAFEKTQNLDNKSQKLIEKLLRKMDKKLSGKMKTSFDELFKNEIVIGFPIEKHRKSWLDSEEVLVAAVGAIPDGEMREIVAYTSKGKSVILKPDEDPTIPTMTFEIVQKKESLISDFTAEKPIFLSLNKNMVSRENRAFANPNNYPCKYFVEGFDVGKNHEPWYDTNGMELYWEVYIESNGVWERVIETEIFDGFRYNHGMQYLKGRGVHILNSYSVGQKVRIEVWEEDNGPDFKLADGLHWRLPPDWSTDLPYITRFPEVESVGYAIKILRQYAHGNLDQMQLRQTYTQ
ncbi:MAG: hypothetical protein ACEPO8_05100 [Rhodothermaceae bacterium]